ncbi:TOMM precursor leader peptide-binding protein [Micromonospora zingiberis]|uniref:TOMM leader peptide-binding protein n=1 Tax=Micromonospora zingiberis TaxID=2053011 RepID=A0A4R0GLB3_9ACTN|nr:TOMM precursor leader peptide-binding protein [Micromonospora zingiberis]TCB97657.1 TOMM precursor leader peptide-binding protein [Micromonospora zingiberis]
MPSSLPSPRPTLLPGLSRLWRDRHTLQLGLDQERAVLVEIADPRAAGLLDLLDGAHSERQVLTGADARTEHARTLLDALRSAGLVVPAHTLVPRELTGARRARLATEAAALALVAARLPGTPAQVLRRRLASRVTVTGAGPLGAAIAVALAQAGVGHVHPDLPGPVRPIDLVGTGIAAGEIGRPLSPAVRAAVDRSAPGTGTNPPRRPRPDLVIQLGADRPAALLAAGHAQRRQPHLLVDIREGVPVIGPLVRPPDGPCLGCLDLHRTDRDPDWPTLAAQLASRPVTPSCAASVLLAATAVAVGEALHQLDGGTPETLGAAIEIISPGNLRRRHWPPHPRCGCSRTKVPGGQPGRTAAAGPRSR